MVSSVCSIIVIVLLPVEGFHKSVRQVAVISLT